MRQVKQGMRLLGKAQFIRERRERQLILRKLATQDVRPREYRAALSRLTQATAKLKQTRDSVEARRVVDEIERVRAMRKDLEIRLEAIDGQ